MPEVFHLVGSFGGREVRPARFEADIYECEVIGEVPRELNGALYRLGPDRQYPSLKGDNTINGDGLIARFLFQDGHVSFRSRYVQTERLLAERAARRRLYGSYRNKFTDDVATKGTDRDNTGNTTAFTHHGRLFALREDSHPHQIDPVTLETLPVEHFGGDLKSRTVTAHPKIDPVTGEWWSLGFFARGEPAPDISLHVFDRTGKLTREEWFEMPQLGIVHDWAVTREHLVFPVMSLTADPARIKGGGSFFAWEPERPSVWGVMPRNGKASQMRWFKVPHVMIGHIMNAFTEGDRVHVDATVTAGNVFPFFPTADGTQCNPLDSATTITRLTFDLSKPDAEAVTLSPFEGAVGDMPRLDERFAMSRYRTGYFAYRHPSSGFGIGQMDWVTRDLKLHLTPDAATQEPLFVPRSPDADEGDGYVLSVVVHMKERRADLLILDGRDITRSPIATVKLPFVLPSQFHGCFMTERELAAFVR